MLVPAIGIGFNWVSSGVATQDREEDVILVRVNLKEAIDTSFKDVGLKQRSLGVRVVVGSIFLPVLIVTKVVDNDREKRILMPI